ncbi:MAG: hypothetical protein CFE21_07590 [Bacteroidetes bacterium B1(2017)]|nr:MAG: hypothetical protein CFE21_07590 [Bacteroidetes bacterium B1(2017)]
MLESDLLVNAFIQQPIPSIIIRGNAPIFEVLSINAAFSNLGSISYSDVKSMSLICLLEKCIQRQEDSQFFDFITVIDTVLHSGHGIRLDAQKIVFKESNGEKPIEVFSHIEITPIQDSQKLNSFLISFLPAIEKYRSENELSFHEKLELERALKNSDRHLNNIVEGIGAGTWEWDILTDEVNRSGEIFEIILGKYFKDKKLPNGFWKSLIFEEDLHRVLESNRATLENPEVHFWEEEFRIKIFDGQYIWIRERGYIFRDENGKAIQAIGATQNINERKNYIQAIEDQNTKLREIAWMQSHVVRAPLARMMGIVELVKTGSLTQDEFLEFIPHFMSSAEELDSIIRDISGKTEKVQEE